MIRLVNNLEKQLVPVGFASQPKEPTDQEVYAMIDSVMNQILGPQGLAAMIKPGDKVILKVNLVGASVGAHGEKGRGVITDPRIVRYVAEKVREIIGFAEPADLMVLDATHYTDPNPSLKSSPSSFYWARLERNGDNAVDNGDVCYDSDGDGILDGTSRARIVNADSIDSARRQAYPVKVADSDDVIVCLPKLLRTREEAGGSDEYCDVLIGLPLLKSHGLVGITGALKLHYGLRHFLGMQGDTGRYGHNGLYIDASGYHHKQDLINYLCAQQLVRKYDLVIMDCLAGNRKGPTNPYGEISNNPYPDEAVDYVLTHAIMAGRDPVAIDTVETVLAGYDPGSIPLLETAVRNGLGTGDPQWIDLQALTEFGEHRQTLYNSYTRDQYPFQDGWGEARIRENFVSNFNVQFTPPHLEHDEVYSIEYEIGSQSKPKLQLVRVELWVFNQRLDFLNQDRMEPGSTLEHGRFEVDLAKTGLPKGTYLPWRLILWDESFNCTFSSEIDVLFS